MMMKLPLCLCYGNQVEVKQTKEKGELLDSQFGYRERRSTQHATTLLVDEIRQTVDNGKMVGALFLDLSKAFDTMSHDLILSKLCDFGVAPQERMVF